MRFGSLAPLMGILLLAACQSGGSASNRNAPEIPSVAVTKSMDDVDQAYMAEHFNHAMDTGLIGQSLSWTNPSSGYQVQVSPTRTFQQSDSTYCREFTQSIIVKSQPSTTHGTACRQSDGGWRIVG